MMTCLSQDKFAIHSLVTKLGMTLAILWTVVHQAPLSMGLYRQQYRSRLPFPSLEDLPNPGIKPRAPALQADSLLTKLQGKPYILIAIQNMV